MVTISEAAQGAMDITFRTKKLGKQLNDEKEMSKAYGARARPIRMRLGVLGQATCLADVPTDPPPRRHQLTENRHGQFAVVIKDNWRLVFEPAHVPVPVLEDGGIDLRQITAISIIEIVDYHGE